jgi:TolB protein
LRQIVLPWLLLLVLPIRLFGVDATLTIEKDVELRTRVAVIQSGGGVSGVEKPLFSTLISDLKISGHFLPDTQHYMEPEPSGAIPASLRSKEYLLKYTLASRGALKSTVTAIRVSDAQVIYRKHYAVPSKEKYPFLAHQIVMDFNEKLGYPSIDWLNRYVIFSRYVDSRKSVIVVGDYTLQYQKQIISGGLNLFPVWADEAQRSFFYTSYNSGIPTLYRLNIYSGSKEKITSSEGMLVCSDVSRDGRKILATMAPDGQADIYEITLSGRTKRRVTSFGGIDVSGRYSRGEDSIVFISNRLGYPNIFKKSITANAVSQVVYRGKNNNMLDVFDNKVIYASREGKESFSPNGFNLYLQEKGNIRPLTSTGINQFPRFSSNGNTILYIKQYQNQSSIGYINLASNEALLFPLGGKVQSIDW